MAPVFIGSPISTGAGSSKAIDVEGNYAYIANTYGENTISVIDISNPRAPVLVGEPIPTGGSGATSIFIQDGYAYVANHDDGTLSVIDIGGNIFNHNNGTVIFN